MKKLLLSCLFLSGCASGIMQGYVGKPVSEAVMDYGMPDGYFDVSKTERAFVWTKSSEVYLPSSSYTSGNAQVYGNSAVFSQQTTTVPAQPVVSECAYTLFAKRSRKDIDGPAAWTVTGFKKPSFSCE